MEGPIICPGHSRPVPSVAYSKVTPDGYFLISGCLDGKAMLRQGETGDWIGTFQGHEGAVWSANLNDTATLACTASADFSAKVWNAITGAEMHSFMNRHIVKCAEFSADSQYLYTCGYEKKIKIYDLNKPSSDPTVITRSKPLSHIRTLPDTNLIACGGREKNGHIYDKRSLDVVKTLDTDSDLSFLGLTSDSSTICITAGKQAYFYDASSFELLKTHSFERVVDCIAYNPQAKKFVTGSDSELWVRSFSFETGEEISCNKGHHGPVRCLAFSPSGEHYASGSEDGTIRIWESKLDEIKFNESKLKGLSIEEKKNDSVKAGQSAPPPQIVHSKGSSADVDDAVLRVLSELCTFDNKAFAWTKGSKYSVLRFSRLVKDGLLYTVHLSFDAPAQGNGGEGEGEGEGEGAGAGAKKFVSVEIARSAQSEFTLSSAKEVTQKEAEAQYE